MASELLTPIAVNAGRARDGKVHVFAGPMFIRPDGKAWERIEDVVDVRLDPATLAWTVRCGGEEASLVPEDRAAIHDNTARTVAGGRRFGHVLRPGHGLREIRYKLDMSAGAKEMPDGWLLAEIDGVKLGLWLRDWQCRFGQRLSRAGKHIAIDLDAFRGEINLDPTTVLSTNDHQHVPTEDAWDTVHDAASSDSIDDPYLSLGAWASGETFGIRRSLVRFDTAGYTVTKAEFFVFAQLPPVYGTPDMRWKAGNDLAGVNFNTTAEYPACLLTGTTDTLAVANDPDDGWRKADVTATFAATDKFDVVLGEGWDADDEEPTDLRLVAFDNSAGTNPPYLSLTLAGGGSRRMLTGVGT